MQRLEEEARRLRAENGKMRRLLDARQPDTSASDDSSDAASHQNLQLHVALLPGGLGRSDRHAHVGLQKCPWHIGSAYVPPFPGLNDAGYNECFLADGK